MIWPSIGVLGFSALTLAANACTDATTTAVVADAASIGAGADASTLTAPGADAVTVATPDGQGNDANEAIVDGASVGADSKVDAMSLTCAQPCVASDPCHLSSCDPITGQCIDSPKPNGAACDDGNQCTVDDSCQGGACVAGKLGGPCGCLSDADCAAKDDGKLCNGILYCDKSSAFWACKPNPGSFFDCAPSPLPCMAGKCFEPGETGGNPNKAVCGMASKPDDTPCDDGVPSTTGDVCSGGVCQAGEKTALCTSDPECATYEDGNFCNGTLFCNKAKKECQINPKTIVSCQSADNTPCKKVVCQPKDGVCKSTAQNEGSGCDDGNACTSGEVCKAGACTATIQSDVCGCKTDSDCSKFEDGDQCNGTLYCNLQATKCQLNPASVVVCQVGLNAACSVQKCQKASGKCAAVALPDGITCDADGSACSPNDQCQSGTCKADANTCECNQDSDCATKDDSDWCNGTLFCNKESHKCVVNPKSIIACSASLDTGCAKNACIPATGQCAPVATNKLGNCDDGDASTKEDTCDLKGQCVGTSITGKCAQGVVLDCTDENPCTDDFCHPQLGCLNKGNSALCTDGDACTDGDKCFNSLCKSGYDLKCDDLNPCTNDGCDAKLGCKNVNNLGPCSDGTACTNGDLCKGGGCVSGPSLDCIDGSDCTMDTCNPAIGCVYLALTATCTDGDACTDSDVCFKGVCKPGFSLDCDDDNACTKDKCDHKLGCTKLPTTANCDDGNACTAPDLCGSGKCIAGDKLNCDDFNPCTDDVCGAIVGCKHVPNTTTCTDGNACTQGEFCTGGQCFAGTPLMCADGNPCTDDGCNPQKGCANLANKSPCDDVNPCTLGDLCALGTCTGGAGATCNDNKGCTADGCDPKSGGCVHLPAEATCDDGDPCTAVGKCKNGQCALTGNVVCTDKNACTDDACDSSQGGCVYTANSAGCSDGNPCTIADACVDSKCVPKATNTCDDGYPCSTDSCDPKSGLCSHIAQAGCTQAPCGSDVDCVDGFCNTNTNACQQCLKSADCGDAKMVCMAGQCALGSNCASSIACKSLGKVCKAPGGYCVACLAAPDCPSGHICMANSCLPKVACAADKDCPAACAPDLGACVECNVNADCLNGGSCGVDHACQPPVCSVSACGGAAFFQCLIDGSGYATGEACDDNNPCTDDSCEGKICVFIGNSAKCSDGDPCTLADSCTDSTCNGGPKKNCNDNNPCTIDSCDLITADCENVVTAGVCSDGNACTAKESCATGKCTGGTAVNCNDGNVCTDDSCSTVTGCQNKANTVGCNSKTCTYLDACKAGKCVSSGVGAYFDAKVNAVLNSSPVNSYGFGVAAYANGDIGGIGDAASNGGDVYVARLKSSGTTNSVFYQQLPTVVHPRAAVVAANQSLIVASQASDTTKVWIYLQRFSETLGVVDSGNVSVLDQTYPYSLQNDSDGGYVMAAATRNAGGVYEAVLVKVNGSLDKVMTGTFNTYTHQFGRDAVAHPDGGYLLAATTYATTSGQADGVLVRMAPNGVIVSTTHYGGAAIDWFNAVAALPGGGFAAVGYTNSIGAGFADGWLVIADDNGKKVRETTFGGFGNDYFNAVTVAAGGGVVVAGYSASAPALGNDGWLVRVNPLGYKIWERTYPGTKDDILTSVRGTLDGGFALSGYSNSAAAIYQMWLLRTDEWGNTNCTQAGACAGVTSAACDDKNVCTSDACNAITGCFHANLPTGAACGTKLTCKTGVCSP